MANDPIVSSQIAQAILLLQQAQEAADDDDKALKALAALVPIHRAAMRAAANGI